MSDFKRNGQAGRRKHLLGLGSGVSDMGSLLAPLLSEDGAEPTDEEAEQRAKDSAARETNIRRYEGIVEGLRKLRFGGRVLLRSGFSIFPDAVPEQAPEIVRMAA